VRDSRAKSKWSIIRVFCGVKNLHFGSLLFVSVVCRQPLALKVAGLLDLEYPDIGVLHALDFIATAQFYLSAREG